MLIQPADDQLEGTFIWIPDHQYVWKQAIARRKVDETTLEVEVVTDEHYTFAGGEVVEVNMKAASSLAGNMTAAMPICNTFDLATGVNDMCTLNHLHEPAVLRNLQLRFSKQNPYTYTGQICMAVNPYQWLDLYSEDLYTKYLRLPKESLPPHPFALSAAAYKGMLRNGMEQSILVSGESGAGKTETVKIMMNHLASISGGGNHGSNVIDKVLKSNPLLESFGNAKTKRNDNSSRFGKFAQLQFSPVGHLVGAYCETYLLEKSRVVSQAQGERNYHIFYQIFALSEVEKKKLRLNNHLKCEMYNYLKTGSKLEVDGGSDADLFLETKEAMTVIGITTEEQWVIFSVISSILNLGETLFSDKSSKEPSSIVSSNDTLENVAYLLGCSKYDLENTLCKRTMKAGSESYTIPLNREQSADLRDAFAKGIYSQLFRWLVGRINKAICSMEEANAHIGLLDIFGFESFEHNGFEQLCINYANEKLQQKFNSDVFKTVQEEYVEEGIPLDLVSYEDNQPILDLIEGRMGIVSILNEEVLRPQATDASFVSKLLDAHHDHPNLEKHMIHKMTFLIRHYAGDVTYEGDGFVEKNKDTLPTDLMNLLADSSIHLIQEIFCRLDDGETTLKKSPTGKSRTKERHRGYLVGNTIAGAFRKQLAELMNIISKTSVQYVRCIKPNSTKSSTEFNRQIVVDQLRCAGVIAAIQISRSAFPNRLTLVEFKNRFIMICPPELRKTSSLETLSFRILQQLLPKEDTQSYKTTKFAIGKSKIYFSAGLLQGIEEKRNHIIRHHVCVIQTYFRSWYYRKQYQILRKGFTRLQASFKAKSAHHRLRRMVQSAIRIQALFRGYRQRLSFIHLKMSDKNHCIYQDIEVHGIIEPEPEYRTTLDHSTIMEHSSFDPPIMDQRSSSQSSEKASSSAIVALAIAASNVAAAENAAREAQSQAAAAASYNRELKMENDKLKLKLSSNIAEFADAELVKENERLRQQVHTLQGKLMNAQEVSLLSAKVVDSRTTKRDGRQFVEYKLQIDTNSRGVLFVWHRYSTFRNLAATLQSKSGYKRKDIPELPSKQLFGNFSDKIIQERIEKLNAFLDAATGADYLQWGIRVDQDTCVYKRRVKSPSIQTVDLSSPKKRMSFRSSKNFLRRSTNG